MTRFLPGVCEGSVSEDSCLEMPPDVCKGSVSEDSSLEMPPDVFEGSVSEDSCLEPPPEQQEIMWMNKTVHRLKIHHHIYISANFQR